jgi:hypothetical protein
MFSPALLVTAIANGRSSLKSVVRSQVLRSAARIVCYANRAILRIAHPPPAPFRRHELRNVMRTLAMPLTAKPWSPTRLSPGS